jgi:hypothetical protein
MGDDVMIEELGIEGFRWSVSGANQSAFSLQPINLYTQET